MSNNTCGNEIFHEAVEVLKKRLDDAIEHAKNIQAGIYSPTDIKILENLAAREIIIARQDLELTKMLAATAGESEGKT